ncbi:unnamed protein product [Calicophoron daubneyi]|uniref:Serine hydroxymethyltransferase n=1 Tax=Calicophoron daubneyi TaxID=300641 RepID=A0AAV2TYQ1_CALDB
MSTKILPLLRPKKAVVSWNGKQSLQSADAELWDLLNAEKKRQCSSLEMVASENFTSRSVLECTASCLTNKYAEGFPGSRLPRGTKFIDQIESLAQRRLLELYKLKKPAQSMMDAEWGVNVQALSGAPANLAAFTALLEPHDRIMGLHYKDGGHFTHGFATTTRKLSAASIFFETMSYKLNKETETIDYDELARDAEKFMPHMIIAGICTHPRLLEYAKIRRICDSVGAILLADMAHISGLVAGGEVPSPFDYADVVTSTTHKTLRGPRGGMIFYRRENGTVGEDQMKFRRRVPISEYEHRINNAIFPGLQSGPHQNTIASLACIAKEASEPDFADYCKQVLSNAQTVANALIRRGMRLVTGGTDMHFVVVDLSSSPGRTHLKSGDAYRVQVIADACGITFSAVPVPNDPDFNRPSGLRIGTSALTARGMTEEDFETVVCFIDQVFDISEQSKRKTSDWKSPADLITSNPEIHKRIAALRCEVSEFATQFSMPGFDEI